LIAAATRLTGLAWPISSARCRSRGRRALVQVRYIRPKFLRDYRDPSRRPPTPRIRLGVRSPWVPCHRDDPLGHPQPITRTSPRARIYERHVRRRQREVPEQLILADLRERPQLLVLLPREHLLRHPATSATPEQTRQNVAEVIRFPVEVPASPQVRGISVGFFVSAPEIRVNEEVFAGKVKPQSAETVRCSL
jgi:hypothetical protein